jgi:hypothetical protein
VSNSEESHGPRLDRVEKEVSTIGADVGGLKSDMAGLKSDMRGFGGILNRIEQGIAQAHQRFDDDKQASRLNPIAMASVLVTIISIIVGGAWLISGQLSRLDERSLRRDMEIIEMRARVTRGEERQWSSRQSGGQNVVASTSN